MINVLENTSPRPDSQGRFVHNYFNGRRNLDSLRRRQIERHARHVGPTRQHFIAWAWHNPRDADPIWSLTESCARRIGYKLTRTEAAEILDEARNTWSRKQLTADSLGIFLGVTVEQRAALGLTTIGGIINTGNKITIFGKRARKELRKRKDRLRKKVKRRALGMKPHSESFSQTQPWKVLGFNTRRTWERHTRRQQSWSQSAKTEEGAASIVAVATLSAAIRKCAADKFATRGLGARQ